MAGNKRKKLSETLTYFPVSCDSGLGQFRKYICRVDIAFVDMYDVYSILGNIRGNWHCIICILHVFIEVTLEYIYPKAQTFTIIIRTEQIINIDIAAQII